MLTSDFSLVSYSVNNLSKSANKEFVKTSRNLQVHSMLDFKIYRHSFSSDVRIQKQNFVKSCKEDIFLTNKNREQIFV